MVSLDRARRLPQGAQPASRRGGGTLAALLVWTLVLCWVAGICILVLSAVGAATESGALPWWSYVVSLALVAVTVVPVQRWVRRGVEDVVYFHHDDAFAVVTRLNRQL